MSTRRRSGTASASGSSSPTAQRRPPAALPPIQAPPRSTSNPHLPHYPREIIALATVRPPPPHVRSLPVNLMDEPPSYAESASTSTAVTPRLTFHRRRSRTNSVEFAAPPAGFIFTPAHTPPDPETSASPPELHRSQKSVSSPHLHRDGASSLTPMFDARRARLSAQNSDEDDDGIVFTAISQGARASGNLRARMVRGVRSRDRLKQITTAPGLRGAGETETEAEDPPSHLPTARIVPASGPLIPPTSATEILFSFSRLLAIVPAVFGTLYNLFHTVFPPANGPSRVEFAISMLWSILTGYQCLALVTGLLVRWRAYYPPLATLIRLLALQAICWPATHFTLTLLSHRTRPAICWAVVGSTTCVSRSVQMWVTSNLWWDEQGKPAAPVVGVGGVIPNGVPPVGLGKKWGGKWGGRRWDWPEVGLRCVLPAGVLYFVWAWAQALEVEWERLRVHT